MRIPRPLLILSLLLSFLAAAGCGHAQSGLEEGLYLRTSFAFGSFNISTFYLAPGNRYVDNPMGGVDPFDFAKADPKSFGPYQFNGKDKISVQWGGGRPAQAISVETKNGKIIALDGGIVTKALSYGKSQMLDATYSGGLSAGGGAVTAARDLILSKDGKFSMSTGGGISTDQASALSTSSSRGTYTLGGNTLTLKFSNGAVEKHTVMPFSTAADEAHATMNDDRMIFDQMQIKRIR